MSRSLSLLFNLSLATALAFPACGGGSSTPAIDAAKDTPTIDVPTIPPDTGTPDLNTPDNALPDSPVAIDVVVDSPAIDAPAADTPLSDARDLAIATDAQSTDAVSSANCATALSGTAPFGKALSGKGTFTASTRSPIETTFTAFVYFPAGRVAGAKVQLAMQSRVTPTQYFFGPEAILADDLSATGLSVSGHNVRIAGTLLPENDGLLATVQANFSQAGTDIADTRTTTMHLCPDGEVPAPVIKMTTGLFSPLSSIGLFPTVPIDIDQLNNLRITTLWGPPLFTVTRSSQDTFYDSGPTFTLVGKPAFPPGQKLVFDPSQIKDVLGRDVTISLDQTRALLPTTTLSELTFFTPPTSGAVACTGCASSAWAGSDGGGVSDWLACTGGGTIADGVLTVRGNPVGDRNVDAMIALMSESTDTRLRVRMAVGDSVGDGTSCMNGATKASGTAVVAVVGRFGETTELKRIACGGGMLDHVFTLPTEGVVLLVVHVEASPVVPYFSPPLGPPVVRIDELAFQ